MVRTARVVAQGMPHHVIQRGNRRQPVFFSEEDKSFYLDLLKQAIKEHDVNVWSYCLMDNHVHLIVVPSTKESLAKCIGWVHKEYTRMINFREGWRGYLWQGRFNSFVMDEDHVFLGVKYVERNPVRAGIVKEAKDYKWSSAKARINGEEDFILSPFYLMDRVKDWASYLAIEDKEKDLKVMRRHGATGRPLGSREFLEALSRKLGIDLKPKKRGPKVGN